MLATKDSSLTWCVSSKYTQKYKQTMKKLTVQLCSGLLYGSSSLNSSCSHMRLSASKIWEPMTSLIGLLSNIRLSSSLEALQISKSVRRFWKKSTNKNQCRNLRSSKMIDLKKKQKTNKMMIYFKYRAWMVLNQKNARKSFKQISPCLKMLVLIVSNIN